MYLIAQHPYFKVEREVSSIDQRNIEHERTIYLYTDKVVTQHRTFLISEVLDISYRTFGEAGGLLYIHTIGGLFSYTVKSSPQKFIEAFEENGKNS